MRFTEGSGKHWKVVFLAVSAACLFCGGSVAAQTSEDAVYEACEPGLGQIEAAELPAVVELERCPVGGRPIVDGDVGSELPDPGEGVYAEALTPDGEQELEVYRYRDGTIELDHVGDDSESTGVTPLATAPGECRDAAYADWDYRVSSTLSYSFNRSTTPPELSSDSAEGAIRKAGANITSTRNQCRMGDRVPATLTYAGNTVANANADGNSCTNRDGESVVSFGDYTNGVLAVACTYFTGNTAGYDEVTESDIKVNKTDFNWTTRPGARSCKNKFDLEGVMTHERGHTFGLRHVDESRHAKLTMSPIINGPCQSFERTLGRGDVLGLDQKYDDPPLPGQ